MKLLAASLVLLAATGCGSSRPFSGTPGGHVQTGTGSAVSSPVPDPARLSQSNRGRRLLGTEVKNFRNETLGKLDDFLIDFSSGRVIYAVVNTGGFLGLGGKRIPVPPAALLQHTNGRTLVLDEPRQILATAPSFTAPALPDKVSAEIVTNVYRFHGIDPAASNRQTAPLEFNYGQPSAQHTVPPGDASERKPVEQADSEGGPGVIVVQKASDLIGMKVRNTENESVGEVRDLVIDLKSGRLAYAVLSVGGFLGLGEKLIAVPPGALVPADGHLQVSHASRRELAEAPGLFGGVWPDLSNAAWAARVYRHHGHEPYWSVAPSGLTGPEFTSHLEILP